MKLQLKMLCVGFLLVLGVGFAFSVPDGVIALLYNAGVVVDQSLEHGIHLVCLFGRAVALVFAGMQLAKWRNRWEAYSPSKCHSTASDFVQRHLLLLLGLVAAACVFWRPWLDFSFYLANVLTMGTGGIKTLADDTIVYLPFAWMVDQFISGSLLQFAFIGFLTGYFGRKSKLCPKTPKLVVTQSVS